MNTTTPKTLMTDAELESLRQQAAWARSGSLNVHEVAGLGVRAEKAADTIAALQEQAAGLVARCQGAEAALVRWSELSVSVCAAQDALGVARGVASALGVDPTNDGAIQEAFEALQRKAAERDALERGYVRIAQYLPNCAPNLACIEEAIGEMADAAGKVVAELEATRAKAQQWDAATAAGGVSDRSLAKVGSDALWHDGLATIAERDMASAKAVAAHVRAHDAAARAVEADDAVAKANALDAVAFALEMGPDYNPETLAECVLRVRDHGDEARQRRATDLQVLADALACPVDVPTMLLRIASAQKLIGEQHAAMRSARERAEAAKNAAAPTPPQPAASSPNDPIAEWLAFTAAHPERFDTRLQARAFTALVGEVHRLQKASGCGCGGDK